MSASDKPVPTTLAQRAGDLRLAFDRSFAQPVAVDSVPLDALLVVLVGADRYALRLSEIAGLFVDRKITPLPSAVPELLGVAGFRGTMLPVYDLGLLLGHAPAGTTRRGVVIAAALPIALAFDEAGAHLRVPRDAIATAQGPAAERRHVHQVAHTTDGAWPLVQLSSVLEAIRSRQP